MIFPFIAEVEGTQQDAYIPHEYGIDFNTGQLSGKIVEGYEALLVWTWLALQTSRYKYYIYSDDYGQEYETLIGSAYSSELTESELERMTEECLLINPYITGIENFTCKKTEEKVTVSFSLITIFGDGEVSVDV